MTTSAANDGGSLAPTVTEGETTAEAGAGAAVEECAEGKEMEVGAAAAVEEPDEEAREEDPQEEEEEEMEEVVEEEEEDAGEVETADGIEAELEPLPVLKPGEDDEHEELDGEKEELDEEPEETKPPEEEPEEVDECKEGDIVAEADGSVANETNEMSKLEYGGSGNTNKDKDADQLSSGSDSDASRSGDMQNSELAGGLEIFVDNLPNDCVKEDIAMAFSQSGEVKSVRIIKNSSTENKDIAFVCYASIEAAKKALAEFKEGIEVKGKMVRVSACQDNNTLYVGNICKGWTKDQVLNTLKSIGIQECKISFPTYKGGSRGFAFLKFASHYYARAAFRRLMKSDAIFGTDRSAKVSFYETSTKSSKNRMETKKVYLEHVPLSWDENKIKEYCDEYGEILKVDIFQISKNMENETISFIEFSSSKGALACVAGINKANICDGSFKLCAYLAWPKSSLKVNSATPSNAATTTEDKNHTEKVVVDKNSPHKFQKGDKSKLTSQKKEAIMKTKSSSKFPNDNDTKLTSQGAAEVLQTSKSSEGKREVGKNKHASASQKPRKKTRNNRNVDESQLTYRGAAVLQTSNTSKGKRKASENRSIYINEKPLKKARGNSNLGGSSRSKSYASDLEPHAGFISPVIRDHDSDAYSRQRTAQYGIHPIDVHPYGRELPSAYSVYGSHAGYETYEYAQNRAQTPPSGSYIPRRGRY